MKVPWLWSFLFYYGISNSKFWVNSNAWLKKTKMSRPMKRIIFKVVCIVRDVRCFVEDMVRECASILEWGVKRR
jgi:hypothetical protein